MKVCLTCSAGGHFTEMLKITESIRDHDYFFITYYDRTKEGLKGVYFLGYNDLSNDKLDKSVKLVISFLQIIRILSREKPAVIITMGGSLISILVCFIGKAMGSKIVFIESLACITNPSASGKIIYPIADLFLVQWEPLVKKYGGKARYMGKLI